MFEKCCFRHYFMYLILLFMVSGCSGGGGESESSLLDAVINVNVTGLVNGDLVLQNNGGSDLTVSSNGLSPFGARGSLGDPYDITILVNTTGQNCTISSGTGVITETGSVTIELICYSMVPYSISANVVGLLSGSIVLQNNGSDDLSVATNGVHAFSSEIVDGGNYDITLLSNSSGQTCLVANASGLINGADILIDVTCFGFGTYSVSSNVTGLLGGSLVLQNNGGDDLTITVDGSHTFSSPITDGGSYNVTVLSGPAGQICSVSNGDGVINGSNVSINVSCYDALNVALSSGNEHTCTIRNNNVECWGSDYSGQITVPITLSNPTQVSASDIVTCVLDDSGVVCWGGTNYGQLTIPSLSNPVQVTAGSDYVCALDDTGVVCWGVGQTTVPVLTNPVQINAQNALMCALDSTGVNCWGSDTSGSTTPPSLTNPIYVSAGTFHACALDDTGVVCWGDNTFGQTTIPTLSNPTQISASHSHSCALDDTGVACWGLNNYGQTTVPALSNPTYVSSGTTHTCALDDTGVVCWGNNASGQTSVP